MNSFLKILMGGMGAVCIIGVIGNSEELGFLKSIFGIGCSLMFLYISIFRDFDV